MEQTALRMSTAEFLELPETNKIMELIHGEVFVSPSPTLDHQDGAGAVYSLIKSLIPDGTVYFAPLDVVLDETNTVQPDVFWVAENSLCVPVGRKYLRGAPDLVVEILSPGNTKRDKKDKFELYEKYGTREYWLMDTFEELMEVWVRRENQFERLGMYEASDTFESPALGKNVVMTAIFKS